MGIVWKNHILLIYILLCSSYTISAQSPINQKITVEADSLHLSEIFTILQKDQPFKIYYRQDDIPTKLFSISVNEEKLQTILNELLDGTKLDYLDYRSYGIIIAPREIISEYYTAEYYKAQQNQNSEVVPINESIEIISIGQRDQLNANGQGIIKGLVNDALNEEAIIGATVLFPTLNIGTATDAFGEFEIELPAGQHEMKVEYIGYEDRICMLKVLGDGEFEINLQREAIALQEVLVKADAIDVNVENAQIGVERLDVQTIKKLPSFMGEADVVKSLLLQPGVSNVGEGAIGFNVRGGQVDQNLVMQDDGFLFNTSHALGFFSTFNPELISFVTLYKGNIPAEFGGRLASVLDVEMRDGSYRKFKINGGIGPVSTKLSFEGPIIKEKTSFIMGFRSTYSDWILNLINVPEVKRSSAFFYDFNARITHKFNDNHTLTLSGYSSADRFSYNEQFGFDYQTQLGQLIFRSIFSDKLFNKFTLTVSDYNSDQLDLDGTDASVLNTKLKYLKIKDKISYIANESLELDAGISSILYNVEPGQLQPEGRLSQIIPASLENERGIESALFINSSWTLNSNWSINAGVRYSMYQFLGPKSVFRYNNSEEPTLESITGIQEFSRNEVISTNFGLSPRISFRYRLTDESSVKFGYSRTIQYINLISNSNTPTPGSQWQLSTEYIEPQRANNLSIGYFKNFEDNLWESSIEIYGRQITDLFDYKNFAQLTVNENLETEILKGIGRAYGAELAIKKRSGVIHGSLSYTLSKSEKKIQGINEFNWYASDFDKPHDLSLIFNIQPNDRNTITFNFNYGSGRPTTAPIASYKEQNGFVVPVYSDRNQLRIPAYHRLDFAYTLGQSYRKDRLFRTSWTFSIYNIYGRSNAFSVFFTQKPFNRPIANKLAILGNAFPALTINFISL